MFFSKVGWHIYEILFPQVVCCGILMVLVLWQHTDAACFGDEHGNTGCHTKPVCHPGGGCVMGAAPELRRPGGESLGHLSLIEVSAHISAPWIERQLCIWPVQLRQVLHPGPVGL
ncbi:unnamed protein product [Meganyctiphanes norvegica]|uniref:Secreted protein n=1 Tax=Meganyctiphanes norvegica TaxID=48144 RepID=A0AAV2QNY8_MEGNR